MENTSSVVLAVARSLARAAARVQALWLAGALLVSPAYGADFPLRPIRIVVDNPAGGSNDIYGRMIGRHLAEALGQPVVIDNRPGASGVIAVEEVLRASPDGYTALFGGLNSLVSFPAAGGHVRYDPKTALIPVALGQGGHYIIAVSGQHEAQSLEDLASYARRASAPITCGTTGNGGAVHYACAALARALGIKMTMVHYKGITFALQDAVAGQIDVVPANPSEMAPLLDAKKLRALAVLGPERVPRAATVPTVAELGYPGQELYTFAGLYYPAGTPAEIVHVVNRAVVKAMQQPDIVERLRLGGGTSKPLDAKQFAEFLAAQQARWRQIAESGGIKVESE